MITKKKKRARKNVHISVLVVLMQTTRYRSKNVEIRSVFFIVSSPSSSLSAYYHVPSNISCYSKIFQFHPFEYTHTKSREENLFAQSPSKDEQKRKRFLFHSDQANNAMFFKYFPYDKIISIACFKTNIYYMPKYKNRNEINLYIICSAREREREAAFEAECSKTDYS